jgi:predicted ferric reductase
VVDQEGAQVVSKARLLVSLLLASFVVALVPAGVVSAQNMTFGDVVVQNIQGPSVAQKFTTRLKTSWPWFLARGSGLVAAAALGLLMLSGIGLITGDTFRFLEPLTAWATHRALGLTFGVAVIIHIVSLLFDTFVSFSVLQMLVPWLSHYKPVTLLGVHLGSLYVALGVLAFYGVAIIVISSLLWVEKKPYTWKWLHLLSYMVLVFVFVHALYLGTDLSHGYFRWAWIVLGFGGGLASLYRLRRARTI